MNLGFFLMLATNIIAIALIAVVVIQGQTGAGLGAVFLQLPALSLAVSAMVALLSAGMILFETSRIVNGGETNYVLATVGLFVSLFNLFTSLLSLFGFGSND